VVRPIVMHGTAAVTHGTATVMLGLDPSISSGTKNGDEVRGLAKEETNDANPLWR
jgi:hypothetical protein